MGTDEGTKGSADDRAVDVADRVAEAASKSKVAAAKLDALLNETDERAPQVLIASIRGQVDTYKIDKDNETAQLKIAADERVAQLQTEIRQLEGANAVALAQVQGVTQRAVAAETSVEKVKARAQRTQAVAAVLSAAIGAVLTLVGTVIIHKPAMAPEVQAVPSATLVSPASPRHAAPSEDASTRDLTPDGYAGTVVRYDMGNRVGPVVGANVCLDGVDCCASTNGNGAFKILETCLPKTAPSCPRLTVTIDRHLCRTDSGPFRDGVLARSGNVEIIVSDNGKDCILKQSLSAPRPIPPPPDRVRCLALLRATTHFEGWRGAVAHCENGRCEVQGNGHLLQSGIDLNEACSGVFMLDGDDAPADR